MIIESPEIEILLPVHNEGEGIEAVMREFHTEIARDLMITSEP
jgi:hypothetical protein